jgi:CO dehydrogenase/acetyl-CoA synthase delta subunit
MGLLPIIVNLLGFLFLWGAVNYVSLKKFRESIAAAAEEMKIRLLALQNHAAQQTDNELHTANIRQQLQIFASLPTENQSLALTTAQWQAIQQIATCKENVELETVATNVILARKKYDAAVRDYNEAVVGRPSGYVAKVFGFKTV